MIEGAEQKAFIDSGLTQLLELELELELALVTNQIKQLNLSLSLSLDKSIATATRKIEKLEKRHERERTKEKNLVLFNTSTTASQLSFRECLPSDKRGQSAPVMTAFSHAATTIKPVPENTEVELIEEYPDAVCLFSDMMGYTTLTENLPPQAILNALNVIYSQFKNIANKYPGIELVKTMGDCIVFIACNPNQSTEERATLMCQAALEMSIFVSDHFSDSSFAMRFGIANGPVSKVKINGTLDIIGRGMNRASRMESASFRNQVQVSDEICRLTRNTFEWSHREMEIKSLGQQTTHILTGYPHTPSGESSPHSLDGRRSKSVIFSREGSLDELLHPRVQASQSEASTSLR